MSNDVSLAFYSAADNAVVDLVYEGRGAYGGKTLEQTREEFPDAVVMSFEEAYQRYCDGHRLGPVEITADQYERAFGAVPPRSTGAGVFHPSELYAGDIATFFVRLQDRYFTLRDYQKTSAHELLKECAVLIEKSKAN